MMLLRTPFREELLQVVQSFSCGTDPWHLEVANWIKAARGSMPQGALDDMGSTDSPCDVWLYGTGLGTLVGIGSLGSTKWRYPNPSKSDPIVLNIIPYIGVSAEHQGQGHGSVILADLMAECLHHPERKPLVGLLVDARNAAAISFYQKKGFRPFGKPRGKGTGRALLPMILDISASGASAEVPQPAP